MLIVHASFSGPNIVFWAEQSAMRSASTDPGTAPAGKSSPKAPLPSPYDADSKLLSKVIAAAGFLKTKDLPKPQPVLAWLPTSKNGPIPSSAIIDELPISTSAPSICCWQVTGISLAPDQAISVLKVASAESGVIFGASFQYLAQALNFVAGLVTQQQFLPNLVFENRNWVARWQACLNHPNSERMKQLAAAMPHACRAVTEVGNTKAPNTAAGALLSRFVSVYCDYIVRYANNPYRSMPPANQAAHAARNTFASVHEQWLFALCTSTGEMPGDTRELSQLASQIVEWRSPLRVSLDAPFKLCFRLNEPASGTDESAEGVTEETEWSVDYLLQACDDPSLLIPVSDAWKEQSDGAKHLIRPEFKPREYLLSALGMAARVSPEIENSLRTQAPSRFECGVDTAQTFLTETAWMLEQAGFGVLLPAWWTRKGMRTKLGVRASVKTPKMTSRAGLSLDSLVDVDWEIVLGESALTLEELEAVARQKSSLVKVRGQWVQLDSAEIEAAIAFWKQHRAEKRSVRDVVRIGLGASEAANGLDVKGVKATGWMQGFLNGLNSQADGQEVAIPRQFVGTLRPYQHRGYAWMEFLRQWGLGACLADDMGLGKTCTTLALVQRQVEAGSAKPVLIVCPTSVIGNWQKEVQRFTPELRAVVHHGSARAKGAAFKKEISDAALVLSSYALLSRDIELLKTVEWGGVILDEAQNIKNPETRQSKAARSLTSDFRIALTGTPVENHIGDLWSLMEFTNPGFLGSQAAFRRKFFMPIQVNGDAAATAKLKQLTTPFLLRRLKTDKTIISDLPEKQEMKVYCTLTSEQATLYRAVVNELEQGIEGAEGIHRSGVVLAALSKIKQICNHPAQFLKDNSGLTDRSGKLTRITEMLEEVIESGDRALLFTQFAEMGELLKKHLQETFGTEVLFLHGGVSKKQRDSMVERFQSGSGGPALFILSLRAGGTGLNLTAANHVFHFDRWWNPAVENQATDRAFRIGQKRNVQVHKFVCLGTLEERIDSMIESKHTLATKVVGTGEDWITKLSNTDLKEMFALRDEAVSD